MAKRKGQSNRPPIDDADDGRQWVTILSHPAGYTAPIKEEEIDFAIPWFLAEDEARHGRWNEMKELLRHPKGRPLTRGEKLFLLDLMEGKVKRPANRPKEHSPSWHSQLADEVAREVGAQQETVKRKKQAIGRVAAARNMKPWKVEKLEAVGRKAHETLQEQVARVIADIKKRGYQ
jgi:hypothetical protein